MSDDASTKKRPLSEVYDGSGEDSEDSLSFGNEIGGEFEDLLDNTTTTKRLRKKKKSNEEEGEPAPPPETPPQPQQRHEKAVENLFDSDDDEQNHFAEMPGDPEEPGEAGDQDQVYVSDQDFSDEEMLHDFVVDEKGMPIKQKEIKRKGSTVTSDQMQTASLIFGSADYDDYIDAAEQEQEQNFDELTREELKEAHRQTLAKHFEPTELEEKFATATDQTIISTDIPERFQIRFGDRPAPEDAEIEQEAEWIFNQRLRGLGLEKDLVLESVVNVLRFLLQEHFEVPFIATYRKEHWLNALKKPAILWEIHDWDEKWFHFQQRKHSLKTLYESLDPEKLSPDLRGPREMIDDLEGQATPEELADYRDHFQLHYGEEAEAILNRQYKRPQKKTAYSLAQQAGIGELKNLMGISSRQFGENLEMQYNKHEVRDPELYPQQEAERFIGELYRTVEEVLDAARLMCAKEIATEPAVRRALRNTYKTYATISTTPTTEGKKTIDAFHPFREVKRLDVKPAGDFLGENPTDKFLKILRAEKDGLLKYTISVPSGTYKYKFVEEMEKYYLSDPATTDVAKQWNYHRKKIIEKALQEFLFPLFCEQLKEKLISDSSELVLGYCAEKLETTLMAGPYKSHMHHADLEEEEGMLDDRHNYVVVMACYYGAPTANKPSECVVLTPEGDYKAHISIMLQFKTRDADIAKLRGFIEQYKPTIIIVSATCHAASDLYSLLHRTLSDMKADGHTRLPHATWGDPEAAEIFWSTKAAREEFETLRIAKKFNPTLERALSLGRRALDPLVEISRLCNKEHDALHLSLHPLQDMVSQGLLFSRLERVFITMVNSVGLDINEGLECKWKAHMFNFISGLGPRKASQLRNDLRHRTSTIVNRTTLESVLGEVCYKNAIGFLRLSLEDIKLKSSARGEYEILDITRIHPEDYNFAWKMAKDALEKDDIQSHVEELMHQPKKLEDLDIDMFAELLEKKLDAKKQNTLYDIKNELYKPFADIREDWAELSEEALFDLFTHTTNETLYPGMVVKARVLPFLNSDYKPNKVMTIIEGLDIKGIIQLENLTDEYIPPDPRNLVRPGETLTARIVRIVKDKFNCMLTAKESDMRSNHWDPPKPNDPYLIEDLYQESLELEASSKAEAAKEKKIFERAIRHPLFKNIDADGAIQHLADKTAGEVVIRPSSQGYQSLTITWKFYKGPTPVQDIFVHIPIKEEEKSNNMTLGKKLKIENIYYDDLNDVIVSFVDPMVMATQSVVEHKRFRAGTKGEVEAYIKSCKLQNPQDIPYAIGVSFEYPGRFLLYYQPGGTVHKDFIMVTPKGLRHEGKTHDTIDRLINYFKTNWRSIIQKKHQSQPQAASRPVQGHGGHAPHGAHGTHGAHGGHAPHGAHGGHVPHGGHGPHGGHPGGRGGHGPGPGLHGMRR